MKKSRIIFMGTPDFARFVLQKMVETQHNVVAVVTVADKPAGRGRKVQISPVKRYALERNIPVLQPENLKSSDFLSQLKSFNADLQVVVAFRMLPKQVWQSASLATFNLHASLLPDYRGAAPINWAIINGERISGVTTFLIDEKIDTGAILLQKQVDISSQETAGTLHDKLMVEGSDLVIQTIEGLEKGILIARVQSTDSHKNAPKIYKETCQIDWSNSGKSIDNFIRGLSPYPGAWTVLCQDDQVYQVKIFGGYFKLEEHSESLGSLIVSGGKLGVYVFDGIYFIEDIQLSGKRRMNIKDFLNGMILSDESYFIEK